MKTIISLIMLSCTCILIEQESLASESTKNGYEFQRALAELYVQKPYLLQPQQPVEHEEKNKEMIKKIIGYASIGIPLVYLFYGTITNAIDYRQEKSINEALVKFFPSLFIKSPRTIGFFLKEMEILLQAYLLKLFLQATIFCFG